MNDGQVQEVVRAILLLVSMLVVGGLVSFLIGLVEDRDLGPTARENEGRGPR